MVNLAHTQCKNLSWAFTINSFLKRHHLSLKQWPTAKALKAVQHIHLKGYCSLTCTSISSFIYLVALERRLLVAMVLHLEPKFICWAFRNSSCSGHWLPLRSSHGVVWKSSHCKQNTSYLIKETSGRWTKYRVEPLPLPCPLLQRSMPFIPLGSPKSTTLLSLEPFWCM